jgi:DDE family transposase
LEWLLLTTHAVSTRAESLAVVKAYKARWRIEELHRTWKRGLCRVEETQLRSRNAVFKWATILAIVASRAMRLTYQAREQPDLSAAEKFSSTELEAIIVLRVPKGIALNFVPTLAQAVRWIADIGGYTGPWNGPPGPTVVGRGLHEVLAVARAFENRNKMR